MVGFRSPPFGNRLAQPTSRRPLKAVSNKAITYTRYPIKRKHRKQIACVVAFLLVPPNHTTELKLLAHAASKRVSLRQCLLMTLDTSALVGTLWSSAGCECSGCKSLARPAAKSSANEIVAQRTGRETTHHVLQPSQHTTHASISTGRHAEPKPSSSQRRGRAALGSNARALPRPVSDPPGVALDAGRLPANANHGNRPHRGGPRSSAAGEAAQRDAEI